MLFLASFRKHVRIWILCYRPYFTWLYVLSLSAVVSCGSPARVLPPPPASLNHPPIAHSIRTRASVTPPPGIVQSAFITAPDLATSVTVTLSTTPTPGDMLIAGVLIDAGSTLTPPAGWTSLDSSLNGHAIG